MSTQGLESIDHTVQLTHLWINGLDEELGWNDRHRSYRLLRALLQALRDWLPAGEAVNLAAELPTLLRGVYFEHWKPAATPVKERSKADFLDRIDRAFVKDPINFPEETLSIAFRFLNTKISAGELEDVHRSLPADIRALWRLPNRAA